MVHQSVRPETGTTETPLLRPVSLLLGLALALAVLVARCSHLVTDDRGPRALLAMLDDSAGSGTPVDAVTISTTAELALVTLVVLVAVHHLAWTTLAVGCALARRIGSSWRSGERLLAEQGPLVVRRAAAIGAGSALALTALVPAASAAGGEAASGDSRAPAAAALDLGWAPTTTTDTLKPHRATTPKSASTTPEPRTVVVRPGDSLWSIAEGALGADATAADIAASWPQWYEHNRNVIGDDADLIVPGQKLLAPIDNGDTP